jgi:hypothetical protein
MSNVQQRVQDTLDNVVKSQGAAGIVFGAVDKKGRILVNEGAGVRSLAEGKKVRIIN